MAGASVQQRVGDAVAALDAALDLLADLDLAELPAASVGSVVVDLTRALAGEHVGTIITAR